MMQTITEEDYDIEVRGQARDLAAAVEETGDDPVQLVVDVLDDHRWFTDGGLSGADYGAIIADFVSHDGDVHRYRDPETLTGADDFETTLQRMAYGQFEADVLRAHERGDYEV